MTQRRSQEAAAKRFYQTLLFAYPAAFRDEYSRELCLVFVDRYRTTRSRAERLLVWTEAIWGILCEAPREHYDMVMQDLRHTFRIMRKDAGATLAAIAVLALGIGSSTLVFSLANGLLLRPLPYPQTDRIVAVDESSPTDPNEYGTVNYLNYVDLRARTRLLSELGIYDTGNISIVGHGAATVVPGAIATESVFRALGVPPRLGRVLNREDCVPHGPKVAVISEEMWREHYGSDPAVIGKDVETESARYQIVGVMPDGFHFPERAEIWFPVQTDPAKANRTDYNRNAIGRLKPGVSIEAARAELGALLTQIHRENPDANNGWRIGVTPIRNALAGEYRKAVITLLVAVGLLLLIACANVGSLLLVRASARAREIAIRAAIGASRSRIVRQLAVESLVLGVAGGVLGILLACVGTPALVSLIPIDLPRWMNFDLDYRVLLFGVAISLLTAIGAGLAPMIGSTSTDLTIALKEGGRAGSASRRQKGLRQWLVVGEVALSVVLLIGAGLMIRSFHALSTQKLGYAPENVLSLHVNYPERKYPDGPKARALVDGLTRNISAIPGVLSVAAMTEPPLEATWTRIYTIEGRPLPIKDMPFVSHVVVTPGYFRTLRVSLLEGRDFTEADYDAPNVMIVSRSFAQRNWPQESAIGKHVRFGPPKNNEPWHTVVGVMADSKQRGLKQSDAGAVYLPYSAQQPTPNVFVVRMSGDPIPFAPAIRAKIAALDTAIAVNRMLSLEQIRDRVSWRERFFAVLVTCFTVIAVLLAAVGFYAMLSYAVSLQRHEIGIRMALGASLAHVRRLVAMHGLRLAAGGLAIGAAAAVGLTRFMRSQLFEVSPLDGTAWTTAVVVFIAVAAVATIQPARRAARVDPVVAMREE